MRSAKPEKTFIQNVSPLAEAIQCCEGDLDLLTRFLRDLWTEDEGEQFSKRWHIAQLLLEGKKQTEVRIDAKATHVLVRRVAEYATGSRGTGGYRRVHQRLHQTDKNSK